MSDTKPATILVENIMTNAVYRVTLDMKIRDVISMLTARHISGAPIIDQMDKVISVISEGDALRLAAAHGLDATVVSILPKLVKPHKLVTLKRDNTFAEAYKKFLTVSVHRIIVIDGNGRLQGVVTRSNILKLLVEGQQSTLQTSA